MPKPSAHALWLVLLAAMAPALPAVAQTAAVVPPGVVATTNNPNLSVASVRLESGVRVSTVIGMAVYGDGADRLGEVDDLVMADDDKVTVAVIAMGGVLGIGSKLVVVPFSQLKRQTDRLVLPGATKDTLDAMPSLVY